MDKKSLFFWFVAFVCAALIFTGCPQEADDPAAEKSADASLTKVKGADITWGVGTGADSSNLKEGTVTVAEGTTSVAAGDFTAAAGATVKVYDAAADLAGTGESETVTITANTTTDVYVLVTAEDGATKLYYKVVITEPDGTDASLTKVKGADITWGAGTGADSSNLKEGTVTVAEGTASVTAGDFTAAAGATVKVYDAAVDLAGTGESEAVTLTAGITTNVYVLVTAEDGATKLYYKVSIAVPKTVSGYTLKAIDMSGAGVPTSGVSLDSATEVDGEVTLKLGGTVKGGYILKAPGAGQAKYTEGENFQPKPDYWVDADDDPAPGIYAAVYISGLFTWESGAKVLAIKNTNQALRLYKGEGAGLLAAEPTVPRLTDQTNTQTIWIPTAAEQPVRWKLYNNFPKDEILGILIWNGGAGTTTYTPKKAKLEIVEYASYTGSNGNATSDPVQNGYSKTVVVDYSAVTFAAEVVELTPAERAEALGATLGSDNATVGGATVTLNANYTVADGATLAVPAGVTLEVPEGITLDVTGTGSISGAGSITVTGTGTAPGIAYSLDATDNYNPTNLMYTSATKNLATGVITVNLGGTVSGGITEAAKTNFWTTDGGKDKPEGNWSWAAIKGLITTEAAAANTVIKQTSQALRYYEGADDILTTEPENPPTTSSSTIYISADKNTVYKLRKYTEALAADETFGVLLWSGASLKTATFEITPDGGTTYTVVVDWSGVTINN